MIATTTPTIMPTVLGVLVLSGLPVTAITAPVADDVEESVLEVVGVLSCTFNCKCRISVFVISEVVAMSFSSIGERT
jgi:hypothetical protein